MEERPDPSHIMNTAVSFMASKTLMTAVDLQLFTKLGERPQRARELQAALGLHERGLYDFLDALVALRVLDRDGEGEDATYRNTAESACFLDERSPAYLGGAFKMWNARLYRFWDGLGDALRTGRPQSELKGAPPGTSLFKLLFTDQEKLEAFLGSMQGMQMRAFAALADKVDVAGYRSLCDVGGGNGSLAALFAQRHAHLACITFDLPAVEPVAKRHLKALGVGDRVEVMSGDFFKQPFPRADVITMGNILHDWDEAEKRALIAKAHAALPPGGMLIAVENIIDDARRENVFGLLMSLNMLIDLPGGFDYTAAQFERWCLDAGFQRTEVIPLDGPTSAAIAFR